MEAILQCSVSAFLESRVNYDFLKYLLTVKTVKPEYCHVTT